MNYAHITTKHTLANSHVLGVIIVDGYVYEVKVDYYFSVYFMESPLVKKNHILQQQPESVKGTLVFVYTCFIRGGTPIMEADHNGVQLGTV